MPSERKDNLHSDPIRPGKKQRRAQSASPEKISGTGVKEFSSKGFYIVTPQYHITG